MNHNEKLTINQWAEEDRPREKLLLKGKLSLSDAELVAILIGSGTKKLSAVELAKQILQDTGNDLQKLAKYSIADLTKFNGIGEAKAISIISALELGRRKKESEPRQKLRLITSQDSYEEFSDVLTDLEHEEFWVLYLNRSNRLIERKLISSGGTGGTVVDNKIIFKRAIEVLASSIVLGHNHPSGSLKPSQDDIKLTRRLTTTGKMLEIPIMDHLILANQTYFSFRDSSML